MAAPGYVVVMINPRGSIGYGQKFTEEISRDWGGKVYDDLMKGVDAAIAKYPFIEARDLPRRAGPTAVTWWTGSRRTQIGSNA